jgi:SAM-dependent methyltransferase
VIDHRRNPISGYSNVDQTGDPAKYVRRLDSVGGTRFWQAVKRHTYEMLELHLGDSVLDVGCGTGDDVRALAEKVGRSGRAVGLDRSATMVAEARRRSEGTGTSPEYYQGDARRLEFPDASFDACRAERVLQHLTDPRCALAEMCRVCRRGGRIVVAEPDYGTLVVAGADDVVTRRVLAHRRDHFQSSRIGGQLPALFRMAGLTAVAVAVTTLANTDLTGDGERSQIRKYAEDAQAAGIISSCERTKWLADLEVAADAGRYRHAVRLFLVGGRKP